MAYYLFHKLGILPSQYAAMSKNERLLVETMIALSLEEQRR